MVDGLTSLKSQFGNLSSQINRSRTSASRDVARLSSGNRITRAADDIAALSISTRLSSRITTLRSAVTNASQATSMLQIMDDRLYQTTSMAERMLSLSVQANSGNLSASERGFLDQEFQALKSEIDRTLGQAEFNGVELFNGVNEADPQPVQNIETITSLDQIEGLESGNYAVEAGNEKFTGYVEVESGEAWLLVGRGRENWEFDGDGQGVTDAVIDGLGTSAAFAPAAYDPAIINDIIQEKGYNLTDVEIRIKRAANTGGTEYQEARWRPTSQADWTWDFDGNNFQVEHEVRASSLGAAFTDSDSRTRDTLSTPGPDTGNNYQRIWTFNWGGKGNIPGFSYGSSVGGTNGNDPNTFLWENTTENHATPYTEVYIRLKDSAASSTNDEPVDDNPLNNVFDPRDLDDLAIWLDASDIDGDDQVEFEQESGLSNGNVASWVNKADNNAALQTNAAFQPLYNTSTTSGPPTITFDGADDFLGLTQNMPETDYTQFVIFNTTDNSGAFTTVVNPVTNTAGSHDRQFGMNGGRLYHRLWNTEVIQSGGTFNDNTTRIASNQVDSTSGQSTYINGVQVASGVKTSSNFNFESGMVIGGHNLLGRYSGDISEVIWFERALGAEEMDQMEGYLANKYNIDLSVSHQYHDFVPLAPDLFVSETAIEGTSIGTLMDDPKGYTFHIRSGNDEDIFELDRFTGEITLAKANALDYESKKQYELEIDIFDADGTRYAVPATINVENVVERTDIATFTIGAKSDETITVSTAQLNSTLLFGEATLNIKTQEAAANAASRVRDGINIITARRSEVGSQQAQTDIISSQLDDAIRNQDVARSVIADTDIASTSTDYANSLVKNQMSISIAAQANNLRGDVITSILEDAIQITT